jgi:tetratricopeptide (TPR) repeat protein
MNAFRRINGGRRGTIVTTLGAAAIGVLTGLPAAEADDWQLRTSNQPDQVFAACSAVIDEHARTDVELSRAYAIRGDWYRLRNRNDDALADFDQAEKLDPKSYFAIAGRGATLGQKGQVQEAIAHYERAIALDPQNPYGYLLRGFARQRQNQLTEAMADYDHAISLRGDVAVYYVRRGTLFNQMGDLERPCRTSSARSRSIRASLTHSSSAAAFIEKRATLIGPSRT